MPPGNSPGNRVLIVGSGILARSFEKNLSDEYEVRLIHPKYLTQTGSELFDVAVIAAGPDRSFCSDVGWESALNADIVCRDFGYIKTPKVIVISSLAATEYAEAKIHDQALPQHAYGRYHYERENRLLRQCKRSNRLLQVVRLGNVFGMTDRFSPKAFGRLGFIDQLLYQGTKQREIIVTSPIDRSFRPIFIGDVNESIRKLLDDSGSNLIIHLWKPEIKISNIVEIIKGELLRKGCYVEVYMTRFCIGEKSQHSESIDYLRTKISELVSTLEF